VSPVYIEDAEAFIVPVWRGDIVRSMLPADAKSQMRRVVRFVEAVFYGWVELGIAIGRYRDKDQVVLILQGRSPPIFIAFRDYHVTAFLLLVCHIHQPDALCRIEDNRSRRGFSSRKTALRREVQNTSRGVHLLSFSVQYLSVDNRKPQMRVPSRWKRRNLYLMFVGIAIAVGDFGEGRPSSRTSDTEFPRSCSEELL
jgi:hypothetical protein